MGAAQGNDGRRRAQRFKAKFPDSPLRKDADARIAALAAAQAAKPVPPGPDQLTWPLLKETTDEAVLQRFEAQFPDSPLRKDANSRIAALRAAQAAKPVPISPDQIAWNFVKESKDLDQLRLFIRQFPDSPKRADAEQHLLLLLPAKSPEAAGSRSTPTALASACRQSGARSTDVVGGIMQHAELKPNLSAAKELRAIAISPDGTQLATGGDDGFVRIWEAASMKLLRATRAHDAEVYSVAFSSNNNLLASAGLDGTVRVWNSQTLKEIYTFRVNDTTPVRQYGVEFAPSKIPRYVDSVGADGNVWIWDLQKPDHKFPWRVQDESTASSGPPAHNFWGYFNRMAPSEASDQDRSGDLTVRSLSFAPSGNSGALVTAAYDGKIRFFIKAQEIYPVSAFTGKALRVAYSPDGSRVASVGSDTANNSVKVWNVSDRTLFKSYDGHHGYSVSVAWSADGQSIAAGGGTNDFTVRLWDVKTARPLQLFTGHTKDVEAVAFHPNEKWLISASEDKTMKVWDIASGRELLSIVGFADGQYLAYAPDGCYTGSAEAPNYVKFVMKDSKGP